MRRFVVLGMVAVGARGRRGRRSPSGRSTPPPPVRRGVRPSRSAAWTRPRRCRPNAPPRPHRRGRLAAGPAIGRADGVVPDGATVFDDAVPGVARLDPALPRLCAPPRRMPRHTASPSTSTADGVPPRTRTGCSARPFATYGSEEAAARWVATAATSPHVSGTPSTSAAPRRPPGCQPTGPATDSARSTATNPGTTSYVPGGRARLPADVRRPHARPEDAAVTRAGLSSTGRRGQGFPDEDGPAAVVEAAVAALRGGHNQYAPLPGVPALREAIAAHQRASTGSSSRTLSGHVRRDRGARGGAARRCVEPGDEVVVLDPVYDSYGAVHRLAGGVRRPVALRAAGLARWTSTRCAPRSRRARACCCSTRRTTRPGACSTAASWRLLAAACRRARPDRDHRRGLRAPRLRRRAHPARRRCRAWPSARSRSRASARRSRSPAGRSAGRAGRPSSSARCAASSSS